jgi:hypothetical protein
MISDMQFHRSLPQLHHRSVVRSVGGQHNLPCMSRGWLMRDELFGPVGSVIAPVFHYVVVVSVRFEEERLRVVQSLDPAVPVDGKVFEARQISGHWQLASVSLA